MRGKHIGSQVLEQMLEYALNSLKLKYVTLEVLETNAAAIHVYEKCGFKYESSNKSVIKNGLSVKVLKYSVELNRRHEVLS